MFEHIRNQVLCRRKDWLETDKGKESLLFYNMDKFKTLCLRSVFFTALFNPFSCISFDIVYAFTCKPLHAARSKCNPIFLFIFYNVVFGAYVNGLFTVIAYGDITFSLIPKNPHRQFLPFLQ